MSRTGRTSTQPVRAQGNSCAIWMASSMSFASIRLKPPRTSLASLNGPIRDLGAAVADADGFRRFGTFEHLALCETSIAAQLVGVREATAHHPIGFRLGQRVVERGVVVDHEDEFHSGSAVSFGYRFIGGNSLSVDEERDAEPQARHRTRKGRLRSARHLSAGDPRVRVIQLTSQSYVARNQLYAPAARLPPPAFVTCSERPVARNPSPHV